MAHNKVVLAALVLAALAASCGGSSRPSANPTVTAPASPPASPTTSTALSGPTGVSSLAFVDPMRGWAIRACTTTGGTTTPCDILATDDGGTTWHVQYRQFDFVMDFARYSWENNWIAILDNCSGWLQEYYWRRWRDSSHFFGMARIILAKAKNFSHRVLLVRREERNSAHSISLFKDNHLKI